MAVKRDAIVIVGAGHVGGRTAQALRAAGWRGPLVLVGEELDAPYERPPLSKQILLGTAAQPTLRPANAYADEGIELLLGARVAAIDRSACEIVLIDGRRLGYRALLLATGGRARRLRVPGADLPGVMALRTLPEAHELAARLTPGARCVVIGGGFIGLEVAAAARARDCTVVVVEGAERLLGRITPAPIAASVHALHASHGVRIRLGTAPVAIEKTGGALHIALADKTTIVGDIVVAGVGIAPNVELAEQAGLAVDNGIVVDASLRTADPRIWAAGDVALFPCPLSGRAVRFESWQNAEQHACVAARNLAGGDQRVTAWPWFWSDQFDHSLQISGDPTLGQSVFSRRVGDGAQIDFHLDGGGRITGVAGFGPTALLAKEFKVARMLAERGVRAAGEQLADPTVKLKAVLNAG